MGFLDKLLKSETAKILTNAAGDMFDKISDDVLTTVKGALDESFPSMSGGRGKEEPYHEVSEEAISGASREEEQTSQAAGYEPEVKTNLRDQTGAIHAKTNDCLISDKTTAVCNKLTELFREEFSAYEIREKIKPSEINGREDARPYTYGVYQNGKPRLFVMVTDHNKQARNEFYFAKKAAGNAGVPFENFLTQFPNTPEYLKEHLSKYL